MPATNQAPSGPGTTGFQWWPTNWHYFVMPDSVKEMLRSDGTAFDVVGDSNITAGQLLTSNGMPAYPIVISLAAEAIRDDEIAPLTNYVAAGGFLLVGSSSFTRNTNGTSRGDFAIASQMGLHMVVGGLTNWQSNSTFTAVAAHRLISHIPQGTLTWQMPSSSEEISWPKASHVPNPPTGLLHLLWQVQPTGATVLAQADTRPYLLVRQYGKGCFIYYAPMQPLIGHGGWAPGMYAYGLLRNAIEWAFQSAQMPVPRLSAWPYPYNAAVVFRHDMEAIPSLITSIEASAQFEQAAGAKGDYFFCTGELRENMTNMAAAIASLQRAFSNYNATIASHNGGLTNINPYVPPLTTNSYDYWHWGPDEVLDLNPPGYSNGTHYALTSISNSMADVSGWITNTNNGGGLRIWMAPYFNATREASFQIQEQLGIHITGDQKLGPFPHWTLSTQTPDKLYSFLTFPVSDWFLGTQIGQSMDAGHTTNTVRALVDFYYNLGGLINLYSHSPSDGSGFAGVVASDYVTYSVAKPRMWSANAVDVYKWWTNRAPVQVVAGYATNGNQSLATLTISGATDTNTSVEILVPRASYYNLQVLTNGVATTTNRYRTNGNVIKLLAGTTMTNAQITYFLPPGAQDDTFVGQQGVPLVVSAPGVLGNDTTNVGGTNLTAVLVNTTARGSLSLNTNGGFTYTPGTNFAGVDSFTYRANDGQTNSAVTTVTLMINPPGYLFFDNFSRATNPVSLAPLTLQLGTGAITNGALLTTSPTNAYGYAAYSNSTWTDYSVQGRVQFPTTNAWGGGVGGRLDPTTGAHYGAWVYPEGSPGGSAVLKLVKFEGWTTWSFTPMQTVSLPGVGTNLHTVTMSFQGTNITVFVDGVQRINVNDSGFDSVAAYTNGGIAADMYSDPTAYTKTLEDLVAAPLNAPLIVAPPADRTNNAGTTASFTVSAMGTNLRYQWYKATAPVSGATNATLTLSNVLGATAGSYSVLVSNAIANLFSSAATLAVIDPVITNQPVSRTNNATTTATFTVGATGTATLAYRWFKNGVSMNNGSGVSGVTTATLTINNALGDDEANYTVRVTNTFGSVTSAPPAVLTVIDPYITVPPASRTNDAGTTATFSVTAVGTSTLSYRWFKNGINLTNGGDISGATTANITISNVFNADAGEYTVVVSNSFGTFTNDPPALLTVNDPVITSQPLSRTNNAGTTATFSVTAVGSPTLSYRWFRNGTALNNGGNISGATSPMLTITNVLGANAGNYTVRVTNSIGSITSAPPAVLTVIDPFITVSPASRTNDAGTTATFSVTAVGTSTLNYRWFKNGGLLGNGGNISGATTATLTLSNVLGADEASYVVTVSNSFGVATSTPPALLTVNDPIITSQPVSRTNIAGTTATFTLGAYGTSPLYQWLKEGVVINGETNATLVLAAVAPSDAGNYSAIVSNAFGSLTSSNALLTVVLQPVILSVGLTNDVTTLVWTSVSGQSYRLQYLDDLNNTNWTEQLPDILATGTNTTGTNATSGALQRFYRVRVVP